MATSPSITDTMTFSLWRGDELLGHAQLSEVVYASTRAMSGPFVPTAAFADVWPAFQAWTRCTAELNARVQILVAPGVAPEAFGEQLRANVPDAVFRAVREAEQAVSTLGLELRDEAGQAVHHVSVQVNDWNLFSSVADSQKALIEAESEAVRQGISVRGYLMVVTHARSATPLVAHSQDSVIPPSHL
jgi:hypothetical protein